MLGPLATGAGSWQPLHHAILEAIQGVAEHNLATNPTNQKRVRNVLDTRPDSELRWSEEPYLCRGLDIFLTHEPCAMCCMA